MHLSFTCTRQDLHLRLGSLEVYAHGPAIPGVWPPVSTPGETALSLGPVTVYLINRSRLPSH